jgi:hypothetical protein
VLKLPIAKILNVWGRAEGFFIFVCVYIVGMIILASSDGPKSYAAGYVIYWIGYYGIYLIMDIFVADTSGRKWSPSTTLYSLSSHTYVVHSKSCNYCELGRQRRG